MIDIVRKENCCGCHACGDSCATHAISFVADGEGFLYPEVDKALCVGCGRCDAVCPVLRVAEVRAGFKDEKMSALAAIAKNLDVLFDSTSGGVFTALAEKIFAQGGFVGGAVWGGDFGIHQVITDKSDALPRLRSSKYAQSDATGFYLAVKAAVDTGRPVLVCGTPCQMVALRLFLGKACDNLIVVDFICRGINSPLVMRKYIDMVERQHGSKIVAIKQKSKELGWHRLTTKFTFADGSVAYDPRETSLFMRGYLHSNAFCRPSCYGCQFKGFPRMADITLADCWGAVDALKGLFNADLGTSLVLLNSEKGRRYFDTVRPGLETAEIDDRKMLAGNKALTTPLPRPTLDRGAFFAAIREQPFEQAMSHVVIDRVPDARPLVRRCLSAAKRLVRLNISLFRLARHNGWHSVLAGKPLLVPVGRVIVEKAPDAHVTVFEATEIGGGIFKRTRLESRVLLQADSTLALHGGKICYGCDIELFNGAKLEIGSSFYANIGATIVCGTKITIGDNVMFGRNVSIRDTNGGHYVNSPTYANAEPVEIGNHVWLCEGVRVMPGVKIGTGSVIAAGAVVTKDVPANSLAAGVPAKIIRTGVLWKA